MPNSRRRKQRVAESQRQLERARRKLKRSEQQLESEAAPTTPNRQSERIRTSERRVSNGSPGASGSAGKKENEEDKSRVGGWFDSWTSVYTGLVHVCDM